VRGSSSYNERKLSTVRGSTSYINNGTRKLSTARGPSVAKYSGNNINMSSSQLSTYIEMSPKDKQRGGFSRTSAPQMPSPSISARQSNFEPSSSGSPEVTRKSGNTSLSGSISEAHLSDFVVSPDSEPASPEVSRKSGKPVLPVRSYPFGDDPDNPFADSYQEGL